MFKFKTCFVITVSVCLYTASKIDFIFLRINSNKDIICSLNFIKEMLALLFNFVLVLFSLILVRLYKC